MKEQLLQLVDLQNIDSKIYDIKRKLQKLPDKLKQMKDEFDPRLLKYNGMKETYKTKESNNLRLDLELKEKEELLKELHVKLSNVKKARELNAVDSEINNVKKNMVEIQSNKKKLAEEIDTLSKEVKEEEQIIQEQEKNIKELEESIQKEKEESSSLLENLIKEREKVAETIPPELLSEYEFIFEKKAGKAIVGVKGTVCTGCHMSIPPQTVSDIKKGDKVFHCQYCSRILFYPEWEN